MSDRQAPSLNPFDDVPYRFDKIKPLSKGATSSRIGSLTVGDVRYIFTQLRGYSDMDPNRTLWTGETAGQFSLDYLMQSTNMTGACAKRKNKE
jgi:hypothetical protein